jgi:hypothetical protein
MQSEFQYEVVLSEMTREFPERVFGSTSIIRTFTNLVWLV